MLQAGLQGVEDEEDQKKLIVVLQRRAVLFEQLAEYFGPDMTLGKLARLEAKYQ